jgi:thiol:disulfide interchange protein
MKAIIHATMAAILAIGMGASRPAVYAADAPQEDLAASGIAWHTWSPAAFDEAKRDHKLVLLHLGAGWCHWCHVMEHVTYRDAEVDKVLREHFVAIHVDQDSRPDLANRYEDYGWPATILFDANGRELVKWQGYIPPERMRALLEATVKDPTPGPSALRTATQDHDASSTLNATLRAQLEQQMVDRYDEKQAGARSTNISLGTFWNTR